ncbi:MAG: FHA domain-containing protein [Myxococcota bacterium]
MATPSPTCALCSEPRAVGLLCAPHARRLTPEVPLLPHHIESALPPGAPALAFLIDCWGRPHALGERATLGREGPTVKILTSVVSRAHAAIERDGDWSVRDLGSHNGTSVNGARLPKHGTQRLGHGDLVHLADVGLAFGIGSIPAVAGDDRVVRTQTLASSSQSAAFALHEHPMGGGGVLELRDGRTFDLPLLQLELLQLLTAEWQRQPDVAPEVRGFVQSGYLMSVLSWDATEPGPDHLKQLIRRTREQLAGSGVGIEGRRGAGYRLTSG